MDALALCTLSGSEIQEYLRCPTPSDITPTHQASSRKQPAERARSKQCRESWADKLLKTCAGLSVCLSVALENLLDNCLAPSWLYPQHPLRMPLHSLIFAKFVSLRGISIQLARSCSTRQEDTHAWLLCLATYSAHDIQQVLLRRGAFGILGKKVSVLRCQEST